MPMKLQVELPPPANARYRPSRATEPSQLQPSAESTTEFLAHAASDISVPPSPASSRSAHGALPTLKTASLRFEQDYELGQSGVGQTGSFLGAPRGEPRITHLVLQFEKDIDSFVTDFFSPHDSIDKPSDDEIANLASLGYELKKVIGKGRYGTVYDTRSGASSTRMAVKTLPSAICNATGAQRESVLSVLRGVAELRHRYIEDVQLDESSLLLVSPFIEGQNFAEWVHLSSRALGEAVRVLLRVVNAMVYAHEHGCAHGDLRPANILITKRGTPRVVDFGMATACWLGESSPLSEQMVDLGFPASDGLKSLCFEFGKTDDMSGVGLLLGQILFLQIASKRPFPKTASELRSALSRSRQNESRELKSLRKICLKLLAEEPEARYSDLPEVQRLLQKILDGKRWWERPLAWFRSLIPFSLGRRSSASRRTVKRLRKESDAPVSTKPGSVPTPEPKDERLELRVLESDDAISTSRKVLLKQLNHHVGNSEWPEAVDSLVGLAHSYRLRDEVGMDILKAVGENVVSLLSDPALKPKDRARVVFATELIRFPAGEERQRVIQLLLDEARNLRLSEDSTDQRVLWAAVRRYASMVPLDDTARLMEFLLPDNPGHTQHIALRAIQTVFSHGPPDERIRPALVDLTRRVVDIALEALDGRELIPGFRTAIAIDACSASAILGAWEGAIRAVELLIATRRSALIEMLYEQLSGIRKSWLRGRDARSVPISDSGVRLLDALLDRLSKHIGLALPVEHNA
jgi:serine/threonine protein kinase